MLFIFNLVIIGLALVVLLAVVAATSGPQSVNLDDDMYSSDARAETGVRRFSTQLSDSTSKSIKIPAVVAAGLQ